MPALNNDDELHVHKIICSCSQSSGERRSRGNDSNMMKHFDLEQYDVPFGGLTKKLRRWIAS